LVGKKENFKVRGWWLYYKSHLPHDPLVIIRCTKQRIMSNSMSLEYEAIEPTQSVECVPETETQDEIPETIHVKMNHSKFMNEVINFISHELTTNDFTSWGDESIRELAAICRKYRGGKHAFAEASRILVFTDSVRENDNAIAMIETYISCM
jgi:hypothetical protein